MTDHTADNWQAKTQETMRAIHPQDVNILHVAGSRPEHAKRALGTIKRFYPGATLSRAFLMEHVKSVKNMHALVLWGGGDIHPASYGQKQNPRVQLLGVDRERDALEIALVQAAVTYGVPVLGICRGMQIINVALGGTLNQDWQLTGRNPHPEYHWLDSVMAPLADHVPTLLVNSYHHQTVAGLGNGLQTVATANGSIEAIWRPGVLGVQWHPESLLLTDPNWADLFLWLVKGGLQ